MSVPWSMTQKCPMHDLIIGGVMVMVRFFKYYYYYYYYHWIINSIINHGIVTPIYKCNYDQIRAVLPSRILGCFLLYLCGHVSARENFIKMQNSTANSLLKMRHHWSYPLEVVLACILAKDRELLIELTISVTSLIMMIDSSWFATQLGSIVIDLTYTMECLQFMAKLLNFIRFQITLSVKV